VSHFVVGPRLSSACLLHMEALGCASCVLNSMRWRTPGVLLNAWVDGHMNFFSSIRCQHSS
jgi:hypothetical protein